MNALDVGHPQLDRMVALARESGFSAKLTGAGGGGCGFVLIDVVDSADKSSSSDENVNSLRAQLEEHGMQCWEVAMGCPGITFLR